MLHGGLVLLFALPKKEPLPKPKKQIVHVSLKALIAENVANTPTPIVKSPPKPIQKPKPIPEPKIQEAPPKPKPKPTPTPKPKPKIKEAPPKPKPTPKPKVQEAPPKPTPIPKIQEALPDLEQEPTIVKEITPPSIVHKPSSLDAKATAKYEQLLFAWLKKHKQYPASAKRMRIEGEGMLRISINRKGQIQKVIVEQSTGNRLLDKAMLKMAKAANPFPAMSQNDPRTSMEFVAPVMFLIR